MLDMLRPASSSKARPALARAASPSTSPASSTSTLNASSSRRSNPRSDQSSSTKRSSSTFTARSKGQQARRLSFETAVSSSHRYPRNDDLLDLHLESASSISSPGLAPFRRSTLASDSKHGSPTRSKSTRSGSAPTAASRHDSSRTRKRSRGQSPLLGGLYFSDLVVVAFFYAVNLLRTCGIAELVDVAFKAFTYICTRLPLDFYQRWSLSRPASNQFTRYPPLGATRSVQHLDAPSVKLNRSETSSQRNASDDDAKRPAQLSRTSSAVASSSDEGATSSDDVDQDTQLSPFHHLTLLLVRFACSSFPHLVPRVLFAEETIGPLVRWRTGGGAAGIVREFTSEQTSAESTYSHAADTTASGSSDKANPSRRGFRTYTPPGFRAFWIGADAHIPVEVRRSDPSSKSATTLLYLHGGGFSLGSVAFYAEALIRIITKVCRIEDRDNDARCIAVEYDLSPTSRFPGPLLQCLRCYAHLIEVEGIDPASITIAGDSAGGNLAMAMLLCLDGQAKSEALLGERDWGNLPMPGKAVLISPWADLRPHKSLAFAHLREPEMTLATGRDRATDSEKMNNDGFGEAGTRTSAWTEAIGQHEWDYVAAEALMHFAQLYAGVLKTPRRVRGPMGWVAHMCAVLAGDDDVADRTPEPSAAGHGRSMGLTAPLAILHTLVSPPQRMARAAHNMLTEPLLNRASPSKTPFKSSARSGSDAFNQVEKIRPSAIGALDPIFPRAERMTDAVPTTADLFIPLWESESFDQQGERPTWRKSDPDFEAAKTLLEESKLINPAIGDWSRIRLKNGMLVLWGDRERLADDIEVWVEHVRQLQVSQTSGHGQGADDQPSQDLDPSLPHASSESIRKSLQERRAASRSPHRMSAELPEHAADWLCTAVEHGPGGVHAWPFVSMYLAGSEVEREKGLEIIARFISESHSSAATRPTHAPSISASLAVQLPASHEHHPLPSNSPPHLNTVSPAGSMPSDISSRTEDGDYPFLGSSYTESEGWDPNEHNELGLEGVYPHETIWPTPTPSTGMGTPADSDFEQESIGHDDLVHRVGLGLREESNASETQHWNQAAPVTASAAAAAPTMEPVHLHLPAQSTLPQWGNFNAPRIDTQRARTRRTQPQPSTLGGASAGRSLADLEAESDRSAPPSQPNSQPVSPGWNSESEAYDSHEDDLDAPSPQEIDRDAYFGAPVSYADDAIPMDPGFYGLAHYHTLRPEGLSDIAEEESQFDTSSVLSSAGGGALSPGYGGNFSPEAGGSPNVSATRDGLSHGRLTAGYTLSTAEMARLREALSERERQYRERFANKPSQERARFPIEDDEAELEESIGDDSDADVDPLDMDDGQGQTQGQPWRSSSALHPIAAEHDQHGKPGSVQPSIHVEGETAGSSTSTKAEEAPAGLRAPPSPAPSTSSRTSSAHDVWW